MNDKTITIFQVFSMMVLFLLGSTLVAGLGTENEGLAWLIILVTMMIGIAIYYGYTYLSVNHQSLDMSSLLCQGFGKWLGNTINIVYSLYFVYIASRVVKDFTYFISQTLFYNIPYWVISFTLVFLVWYACIKGIETIARSSEVLIFITFGLMFFVIIFSVSSSQISYMNLRPYFPNEWYTHLLQSIPAKITFPYGELVVFLWVFPYLNKPRSLYSKGVLAVLLAGGTIIILSEIIIAMLGQKMAAVYTYPLVKAIEMINFFNIIQHVEFLSVIAFLCVGFIKIAIFTFAAAKSTSMMFKKPMLKQSIHLYSLVIFFLTFMIARNLPEHNFIGLSIVPIYIHIPLQFGIPAILAMTLWVKKKRNGKKALNETF
ncbi:GerAB/ArcD/ProY family transporter [Falsibacillus albus]|uniref:Uncharacterized protein n=1 Tax=Falsibacillus albus TaxID=2478915 RepID=A0A3L7K0S2_9BACI|nr:endospore germination permease [Falsibacillus albus]RLQ95551.1 hypothetical protein D9X91_11015 [Falsibacillus albus]